MVVCLHEGSVCIAFAVSRPVWRHDRGVTEVDGAVGGNVQVIGIHDLGGVAEGGNIICVIGQQRLLSSLKIQRHQALHQHSMAS